MSELPQEGRPVAGSPPSPDPNVVFLANLFILGALGYWLLGEKVKAIVAAVLWLALAPYTCLWGSGVVALIAAIDGHRIAQKNG